MRSKLIKGIVFALLGLMCWIVLIKVVDTLRPDEQETSIKSEVLLEYREIVVTGVSSDEKERIVAFVDTFERAIAQRDSERVLSFFSAPETDEEQKELDFIRGSDYERDGAKPLARLFTTQGYNFSTSAHYVRNVGAQGANVRVIVDELRIIPSGGEWVGYLAQVSRLVVELRESPQGYEVVRYYQDKQHGKYDGFIAE